MNESGRKRKYVKRVVTAGALIRVKGSYYDVSNIPGATPGSKLIVNLGLHVGKYVSIVIGEKNGVIKLTTALRVEFDTAGFRLGAQIIGGVKK